MWTRLCQPPPYSQAWDPTDKKNDKRYARFGVAPKTKADFAFLLHDLYHLKPDGIMTIVLPHGVLFRGGEEGEIRKNLIEQNHIDAIIGLPANIFYGTGIPTIIMALKKRRATNDVLIIDASKGFAKVGKNNMLRASDIKKITDAVAQRTSIDKFSRVVSQEEIRQNEYNLNIPRYVDSSDAAETWDIYASMFGGIPQSEIALLQKYWDAFAGLRDVLFAHNGSPYCTLGTEDIEKAVSGNESVQAFQAKYDAAFGDFAALLRTELIEKMMYIDINKEEQHLSETIFERLKTMALVDKYHAFQALDDEWTKTAVDLEILQTEGFDAAKKVDPNMALKKKDGKDEEIQDGWAGHVIPFELVQATLLKEEADALKQKEERLAEIGSSYGEIIDSLSEEDKESDVLNDAKDAFVAAAVAKEIKSLFGSMAKAKSAALQYDEDAFERRLVQVASLFDEEKELKAQIKKTTAELALASKEAIEHLTDEQVNMLLEMKWIAPLMSALQKIPDTIIADLVASVRNLADKYAVTYAEIAGQIADTKASLSALMDGLTGNEYDMKGIGEFQALLKGDGNG